MSSALALINNHDAQVIGMFLDTKGRRSKLTAEVYRGEINQFFKIVDYKSMPTITYQDLVDYSLYLSSPDPGRNPVVLDISTQNRKIATIKSLFKYAMRIGYITLNPAEPLETQRVSEKTYLRILSDEELLAILKTGWEKGYSYFVVLYFLACTGCRESEFANIMWRDFFVGPNKDICVSLTGKGNKTRVLKIPPSLWRVIIDYRALENLSTTINPLDKSVFFPNQNGNNCSRQKIWKIVKECVADAGIKKDASPHWLRHTHATSVANDVTANLWQLQQDMGHASITTTQKYVHIARGMEDTSIDHVGYLTKIETLFEDGTTC